MRFAIAVRRVVNVNGKALADAGPSLAVLLTDGASDDYDQARLSLSESARHNLGGARTTNLPNLPLEFLHPRNRHRLHHRLDGMEKIRGVNTARMVFEEHSTPTMIQRPEGGDMQSLISAWIEPDTGRRLRAQVKTRDARIGVLPFDQLLAVEFRADEKLGMLVPYEMKEEFFAGCFAKARARRDIQTTGSTAPPRASSHQNHETRRGRTNRADDGGTRSRCTRAVPGRSRSAGGRCCRRWPSSRCPATRGGWAFAGCSRSTMRRCSIRSAR